MGKKWSTKKRIRYLVDMRKHVVEDIKGQRGTPPSLIFQTFLATAAARALKMY